MAKITGEEGIAYHQKMNKNLFNEGLTIRQYFAAMAMQGLCASGIFTDKKIQIQAIDINSNIQEVIAVSAVDLADALIEELNKK